MASLPKIEPVEIGFDKLNLRMPCDKKPQPIPQVGAFFAQHSKTLIGVPLACGYDQRGFRYNQLLLLMVPSER